MIQECAIKTREQIHEQCQMEMNRPFTLANVRFKAVVDDNITELLQKRYESLTKRRTSPIQASSSIHTIRDTNGLSHSITSRGIDTDVIAGLLAAKGFPISSPKQLARLHTHGDCYVELEVIATVQAYFEFSTESICDVASQLFENVFVRRFVSRLKKYLIVDLGLVGEDGHSKCVTFARDEPRVEEERQLLEKQKEILLKANDIITKFYL